MGNLLNDVQRYSYICWVATEEGEEGLGFKGIPADLVAFASAAEGDGMAAPRCPMIG